MRRHEMPIYGVAEDMSVGKGGKQDSDSALASSSKVGACAMMKGEAPCARLVEEMLGARNAILGVFGSERFTSVRRMRDEAPHWVLAMVFLSIGNCCAMHKSNERTAGIHVGRVVLAACPW